MLGEIAQLLKQFVVANIMLEQEVTRLREENQSLKQVIADNSKDKTDEPS